MNKGEQFVKAHMEKIDEGKMNQRKSIKMTDEEIEKVMKHPLPQVNKRTKIVYAHFIISMSYPFVLY